MGPSGKFSHVSVLTCETAGGVSTPAFHSERCVSSVSRRCSTPCTAKVGVLVLRRGVGGASMVATWLILPVVICLSQRLSHACLSINYFVL
jgi:hypothetical protein